MATDLVTWVVVPGADECDHYDGYDDNRQIQPRWVMHRLEDRYSIDTLVVTGRDHCDCVVTPTTIHGVWVWHKGGGQPFMANPHAKGTYKMDDD